MLSREFVEKVKLDPRRAYTIAHQAGVHPSTLSKLMNGIEKAKPRDPRVLRLARVLGLPPDACFEDD